MQILQLKLSVGQMSSGQRPRPRGTVALEAMPIHRPKPPSMPPPPWLSAQSDMKESEVLTPPVSDDDNDDADHGVAELKTDGEGENEHGQVKDPCAIRFKNLNLWLDKPGFKRFLQHTLGISDDGHAMK